MNTTKTEASYPMVARTLRGLEPVLAEELRALGAGDVQAQNLAVAFTGNDCLLVRANLWLRTGLRIIKPIHRVTLENQQDLYDAARQYDWSRHLKTSDTFAIDTAVHSPLFTNSQFVAFRVKDAIVDRFRDTTGRRPSVDIKKPTLRIHVHILRKQCVFSLDSSGQSLHRRGYRKQAEAAPIMESLAAGLILLSGWKKDTPFYDPMCGAGTIAIEAALLGAGIPPGWQRRHFGFLNWPGFSPDLWEAEKEAVRREVAQTAQTLKERPLRIIARDLSPDAIATAHENARRAGLPPGYIDFQVQPFDEFIPAEPGVIVMNPPYGERLQKKNIDRFYKHIGDHLKQKCAGSSAWILSSNLEALKQVGLQAN
ncbi:MAG: hypothetical protein KDK30_01190, partial [Leptospiraceae bacterium]|nr:hypothetical protein [Leptospiraceae bacterium]